VLLLRWAYINWLSLVFGYYGFTYAVPPDRYLALAFVCSVLPSLWMPMEVTRPSQLGYWVLYLTVFIPSMIIPLFVQLSELPSIALGNGISLEAVAGGPPVTGQMEGPEDEIDHGQVHGETCPPLRTRRCGASGGTAAWRAPTAEDRSGNSRSRGSRWPGRRNQSRPR